MPCAGRSGDEHVETQTYTVPPPVTEIDLRLDCTPTATPPSGSSGSAGISSGHPAATPKKPGLAVARAVATVKRGKALLQLRCDGQGACAGVAKLLVRGERQGPSCRQDPQAAQALHRIR